MYVQPMSDGPPALLLLRSWTRFGVYGLGVGVLVEGLGASLGLKLQGYVTPKPGVSTQAQLAARVERESSLLTTYWSGSTDVFGVPAKRHGSLNPLFQVALYLPSWPRQYTHVAAERGGKR